MTWKAGRKELRKTGMARGIRKCGNKKTDNRKAGGTKG
jgi:hypothetical protein